MGDHLNIPKQPTIPPMPKKPERCGDCISRKAVLESLETDCSLIMFDSYGNLTFTGERIIEAIKRVPSVEPERKPGKWMPHMVTAKCESSDHEGCSECQVCFYGEPTWSWKYCPNCGKPMEVQNAKDINISIKLDDFDRSGEEWR